MTVVVLARERNADPRVFAIAARLHQAEYGAFDFFELVDAAHLFERLLRGRVDAEHHRIDLDIAEKISNAFCER